MNTATQAADVALNSLTDRELENCWLMLASLSDLREPEANWTRRLIVNFKAELDARHQAA